MKKGVIHFQDRLFKWVTWLFALVILGLSAGLLYQLAASSRPSFRTFGFHFLISRDWDPVKQLFGALPFIWGTLFSATIALLIALPVSLGIAIFLTELSPGWLRKPVSLIIELLAAIPSVIYGIWGLFVLAPALQHFGQPFLAKYLGFLPFFRGYPLGVGMLAAGIILAIMITPTISSISREVLATVPDHQKEAGLALGMTRWEVIRKVMIPYGRSGVAGAVLLGYGRALGETMAVAMVIGNTSSLSLSLFQPGYTIAGVIANEFPDATYQLHISSLAELGFILFVITLSINILARLLLRKMKRFELASG